MREPRWSARRPAAVAAAVGLVFVVLLFAAAPSSWSAGWSADRGSAEAGTGLRLPDTGGTHPSTAPRVLAGGAEHLPTPGQLRSLPAVGEPAALLVLLPLALLGTGPVTGSRRCARRVVTPRSPPLP
ncbi:hypothetical protein [Planomonospora sp. ID82291]|uniref:hypothetical protein n=1 Tax=Planomonospora sp. ID82291 TaxID=2738136 RepID=UPI0018C35BDA|nr:hypothetical protein [Planomonospora sp. ID82291]MBG0817708.1 hypothetical protein [Planomonospora sp. ID82291]